jgi:hypothetical protein
MKQHLSISVLKAIYYSLFHSRMSYGIIFWGNSSYSHTIFCFQKHAIRAVLGYGNMVSCRNMFKELNIFPLAPQYLFSYSCTYHIIKLFFLQTLILTLLLLDKVKTCICLKLT